MEIITINWTGPYKMDNICYYERTYQGGIYAISRIWGSNESLLYLGRTERNFATRINEHQKQWLSEVSGQIKLRFGILQYSEGKKASSSKLNDAEAMLINWHKPTYNIMCKNYYYGRDKLVLINMGRKGQLADRISTDDFVWYK
ncbi:MAG: GIY-YIG nuclease family protein [Veillonellaceae bacterium]|nr:GIY-YIG nuclease family protein [Veillonellaceae bacterium]